MPGELVDGQGVVVAIDQGLVVLVDAMAQQTATAAGGGGGGGTLSIVLQTDSGFRGE